MDSFRLYDCLTNSCIEIKRGKNIKSYCEDLGIDYTSLYKLNSKSSLMYRYILSESMDNLFILVDIDTGKEYICCSNKTLFLHLNIPYSDNDGKYVYELRSKRQKIASIGGIVFCLKGTDISKCKTRHIKSDSILIDKMRDSKKQQLNFRSRLRKRVYDAIVSSGARKMKNTETLIGCDMKYFSDYIKKRFTKGMSFDNYGEWHIDHIIPCESFDLTNPKEQLKCFHYSNMQPIWKSNKIAKEYGESDVYIGNFNKSNKDIPIDYNLMKKIIEASDGKIDEKGAFEFSMHLVRKGIRLTGCVYEV